MNIERHHSRNQTPAALLARPVRSRMARSVCRALDEPHRQARASPDSHIDPPLGMSQATQGTATASGTQSPRSQIAIAP